MSATDSQSGPPATQEQREALRRILAQRVSRYGETGPDLSPIGSARFRQDGPRLLIAFAVAHPGMASAVVERVRTYARARALSLLWTVTPEAAGEEEFPAALRAAGFALDEWLILMARRGATPAPTQPVAQVTTVSTWNAMWAYEYGSRRAFYNDPRPDEGMVTARARERWRQLEQGWYRYYNALIGDRVVGGAYVTLWEDIPTIMGVYTAEEARGQGVATAVLAQVTADLARQGREMCCLYVKQGNPAQRLYRALGFVPLATEEDYVHGVETRA